MAADYPGALAAIRQRFVDNWVTGGNPTTQIAYVNEPFTPPADGSPWVLFEIVNNQSYIETIGGRGNNAVVYPGLIKGHVFVQSGSSTADAYAKAAAFGEIFRDATFFDDVTQGCFVRSGYRLDGQPRIDEGDASSDDGSWFAVTGTIEFEYWHRA